MRRRAVGHRDSDGDDDSERPIPPSSTRRAHCRSPPSRRSRPTGSPRPGPVLSAADRRTTLAWPGHGAGSAGSRPASKFAAQLESESAEGISRPARALRRRPVAGPGPARLVTGVWLGPNAAHDRHRLAQPPPASRHCRARPGMRRPGRRGSSPLRRGRSHVRFSAAMQSRAGPIVIGPSVSGETAVRRSMEQPEPGGAGRADSQPKQPRLPWNGPRPGGHAAPGRPWSRAGWASGAVHGALCASGLRLGPPSPSRPVEAASLAG